MPRPRSTFYEVRHSNFTKSGCNWLITGYPAGKRRQIWYPTEKAATKAANEFNEEIAATGKQDQLPHAVRIAALDGVRRLTPFGRSLTDAVDYFVKHLEASSKSVPVSEFLKRYREEQLRRLNAKEKMSPRHYETILYVMKKVESRYGDGLLSSVDGGEFKTWISRLDLASRTKRTIFGYSHTAFDQAVEWKFIESNPLKGIKKFPKTETEIDESSIFTPEEISALLKVADPDLIPTIVIGAFAGLRDSEIAKLDWSLVNLEKREIEVKKRKSKTQQRRFVAISDNLLEWLKIYKKGSGLVAPVSPLPRYLGKYSRKRASELRKAARIAAGIGEWVENGLRHSFCSYHYEQHKDAGLTAHQAGHQNPATTFADYRDLVTKEAAARYWAIVPSGGISNIIPMAAAS